MGEAKRRKAVVERLAVHAREGRLVGLPRTEMAEAGHMTLARTASHDPDVARLLVLLDGGNRIYVSDSRRIANNLRRRVGVPETGLKVFQVLEACHLDVPGSGIVRELANDPEAALRDEEWFAARPGRWLRMRRPVGSEGAIREPDEGFTPMTVVVALSLTKGLRTHYAVAVPECSKAAEADTLDDSAIEAIALEYGLFHRRVVNARQILESLRHLESEAP